VEQNITETLVTQYMREVVQHFRRETPYPLATLVHVGPQAPPELLHAAARQGIALKTFAEYQGIPDFTRYLAWQTGRLESDEVYPPWLYVEQPARVSVAGSGEEKTTEQALATLWELLDEPQHPRFALVLGESGAGKTFLLHELARQMAKGGHPLVPILVEMSRLEKQRSLRTLLAQHFAMVDMGRFDLDAFQSMLSEGRIALLFDGFDELALRLTYDRAVEHFETVLQATQGKAKGKPSAGGPSRDNAQGARMNAASIAGARLIARVERALAHGLRGGAGALRSLGRGH
jgi:NACHT domain